MSQLDGMASVMPTRTPLSLSRRLALFNALILTPYWRAMLRRLSPRSTRCRSRTPSSARAVPDFADRTLPAGRAQGTQGPVDASKAFRAAVPDMRVEIEDMVVAADRVTVHLRFRGHFTGEFGRTHGQNQPIDFQAFDLYRIADGKIAENWHLEDNQTLLRQMGLQP